jgi:hypothetical protein
MRFLLDRGTGMAGRGLGKCCEWLDMSGGLNIYCTIKYGDPEAAVTVDTTLGTSD